MIEGSTDPCNIPFMLREQIQKQLKKTQQYILTMNLVNATTLRFSPNYDDQVVLDQVMNQSVNANLEIKPLK